MSTRDNRNDTFGEARNLQELAAPGVLLNTTALESDPHFSADGRELYFGSNRDGTWDIYVGSRGEPGGLFDTLTKLPRSINTEDLNDAGPSVTADGLSLFFHRDIPQGQGFGEHNAWVITRDNTDEAFGENREPVPLAINTEYEEFQPHISADGLTLFISDWVWNPVRPGGVGGGDIWVATRQDRTESFSEPVNLKDLWPGSIVNTEFGEATPYLSADWPAAGSKLYFTSNRPGTLGGSEDGDIWEATWIPASPQFRRADANADGLVDQTDASVTLSVLFLGQEEIPCDDAADSNDDGDVDISDAIFTLQHIFGVGSVAQIPPPNENTCGPDPTEDQGGGDLGCEEYPGDNC